MRTSNFVLKWNSRRDLWELQKSGKHSRFFFFDKDAAISNSRSEVRIYSKLKKRPAILTVMNKRNKGVSFTVQYG